MQRLRANPPDHTSHTVTASGGWKPSGVNTALQKSNLWDEVIGRRHRTPPETHHSSYRAELASSWESWQHLPSAKQFFDFVVKVFIPHFQLRAPFTQLLFYNGIINF